MSEDLIVHLDDLHTVGYCHRGARRWFARQGWDWLAFVRDGLPVEAFEATGDAMALKLAQFVRTRNGQ